MIQSSFRTWTVRFRGGIRCASLLVTCSERTGRDEQQTNVFEREDSVACARPGVSPSSNGTGDTPEGSGGLVRTHQRRQSTRRTVRHSIALRATAGLVHGPALARPARWRRAARARAGSLPSGSGMSSKTARCETRARPQTSTPIDKTNAAFMQTQMSATWSVAVLAAGRLESALCARCSVLSI